ncbi:transposase [Bradyrhizobium sp. CAR08]
MRTTQSPFVREMIERLQAVYAIEAEIRGISAEQRLAVRRTRSAPLMAALKARLTEMVDQLFSQSKLTVAINYALNHWDGLTLFVRDGRIEVDSNTVERSMRPIAWEDATRCSAAARVAPKAGQSWPRWSTRQSSMKHSSQRRSLFCLSQFPVGASGPVEADQGLLLAIARRVVAIHKEKGFTFVRRRTSTAVLATLPLASPFRTGTVYGSDYLDLARTIVIAVPEAVRTTQLIIQIFG